MSEKILVTGGAGFIGSHTCVELLKRNYKVIIFDNFYNSSKEVIKRIKFLTNKNVELICADVRDEIILKKSLKKFQPDAIIHFAGLKAVGESVNDPISYYDINVIGGINILKAMSEFNCNKIVFSSSATVYDNKLLAPYIETDITNPISPYGQTKLIFEKILEDWVKSKKGRRALALRYFNPVGAHKSGLIGEDPKGTPNNLMPFITQVASGKREKLYIFGDDFLTRDGTGERDYIHVMDLAIGHLKAIEKIDKLDRFQVLNLGSGKSTTVNELIHIFEKTNGINIPKTITRRRLGDVARSFADPKNSFKLLGFKTCMTLEDMCADSWNWQRKNPNGYED